jgi:23S rRNA (uracil1939-C5)-methyltransferase
VKKIPAITTVVNTINDRKAQIAYGEKERVYYGPGSIQERLAGFQFAISASSFFQTNTTQAETLYRVAAEFARPKKTDTVYDLYSGTGTIAMTVSASAGLVIGIESVESAIKDAERNVRENGITNCRFVLGDLKDRLTKETEWKSAHPKPDVLMIDPPRSGMHPKVVEEVRDLGASRIVYVSCNPATQARDCKVLCEERYRLVKLQPVDMFPHTYHIENVALLEPA